VRLEGLGHLKKPDDLIGNRTRDLTACSIVPIQTTLPRAPEIKGKLKILIHESYLLQATTESYSYLEEVPIDIFMCMFGKGNFLQNLPKPNHIP
jgi:hypothetical protein